MKLPMQVLTTHDQSICHAVLAKGNLWELLKPLPPSPDADGILQLGADCWLVGENKRGIYTLHFLEGATKDEAFSFFDALNGGHSNPRISVCGPSVPVPASN